MTLDERGFSWLITVAVHEAWRLGSTAREQAAGTLTAAPGTAAEGGELPEPADREHRPT